MSLFKTGLKAPLSKLSQHGIVKYELRCAGDSARRSRLQIDAIGGAILHAAAPHGYVRQKCGEGKDKAHAELELILCFLSALHATLEKLAKPSHTQIQ
jgi:hypothetical protein